METLVHEETNVGNQVKETFDGRISSSPSSSKPVADPVIYKLVRVEGDGRLVPATDDEVMEVEDLLDDDKNGHHLVEDSEHAEDFVHNEGLSYKKDSVEGSEGLAQCEDMEADARKLNARLEYIEVMLQKVKREERIRLSCEYPSRSSNYMKIDARSSDQYYQLPSNDEKLHAEAPLQETASPLSPRRLEDTITAQLGSMGTCSKSTDELITHGSLVSDGSTSSIPDFSLIKGEICLDNLSIRELHETFRATFGRETSVKDKLWLKRRIAMGLTNSCDVSTTSYIIKNKTLICKNVNADAHLRMENNTDGSMPLGQASSTVDLNCKDSPIRPANQMENRPVLSGKRLRNPKTEHDVRSEEHHVGQTAAKRVRKPTKRYIEELSEVETRECSGRSIPSLRNSGHGQFSPKSWVRPGQMVGPVAAALVTRQDSLGGSGVDVPYVSRVRRGRPRKNFMALMKYHQSGMAAKLVKKALGLRVSRQDGESGGNMWKVRGPSKQVHQPTIAEAESEEQATVTCADELQQAPEQEKSDSCGETSDEDVTTVPTVKGGTRRKHHRAWTLCEVMKLVEGVSRYGAGRWSEIKRLAFASYSYRTSVDLKDKWRNLLRASFSQAPSEKRGKNSRKHASIPIPAPILIRVRELAELQSQSSSDQSSSKLVGRSGRVVHEPRSGYL